MLTPPNATRKRVLRDEAAADNQTRVVPFGVVEDLVEPRTQMEAFFSI